MAATTATGTGASGAGDGPGSIEFREHVPAAAQKEIKEGKGVYKEGKGFFILLNGQERRVKNLTLTTGGEAKQLEKEMATLAAHISPTQEARVKEILSAISSLATKQMDDAAAKQKGGFKISAQYNLDRKSGTVTDQSTTITPQDQAAQKVTDYTHAEIHTIDKIFRNVFKVEHLMPGGKPSPLLPPLHDLEFSTHTPHHPPPPLSPTTTTTPISSMSSEQMQKKFESLKGAFEHTSNYNKIFMEDVKRRLSAQAFQLMNTPGSVTKGQVKNDKLGEYQQDLEIMGGQIERLKTMQRELGELANRFPQNQNIPELHRQVGLELKHLQFYPDRGIPLLQNLASNGEEWNTKIANAACNRILSNDLNPENLNFDAYITNLKEFNIQAPSQLHTKREHALDVLRGMRDKSTAGTTATGAGPAPPPIDTSGSSVIATPSPAAAYTSEIAGLQDLQAQVEDEQVILMARCASLSQEPTNAAQLKTDLSNQYNKLLNHYVAQGKINKNITKNDSNKPYKDAIATFQKQILENNAVLLQKIKEVDLVIKLNEAAANAKAASAKVVSAASVQTSTPPISDKGNETGLKDLFAKQYQSFHEANKSLKARADTLQSAEEADKLLDDIIQQDIKLASTLQKLSIEMGQKEGDATLGTHFEYIGKLRSELTELGKTVATKRNELFLQAAVKQQQLKAADKQKPAAPSSQPTSTATGAPSVGTSPAQQSAKESQTTATATEPPPVPQPQPTVTPSSATEQIEGASIEVEGEADEEGLTPVMHELFDPDAELASVKMKETAQTQPTTNTNKPSELSTDDETTKLKDAEDKASLSTSTANVDTHLKGGKGRRLIDARKLGTTTPPKTTPKMPWLKQATKSPTKMNARIADEIDKLEAEEKAAKLKSTAQAATTTSTATTQPPPTPNKGEIDRAKEMLSKMESNVKTISTSLERLGKLGSNELLSSEEMSSFVYDWGTLLLQQQGVQQRIEIAGKGGNSNDLESLKKQKEGIDKQIDSARTTFKTQIQPKLKMTDKEQTAHNLLLTKIGKEDNILKLEWPKHQTQFKSVILKTLLFGIMDSNSTLTTNQGAINNIDATPKMLNQLENRDKALYDSVRKDPLYIHLISASLTVREARRLAQAQSRPSQESQKTATTPPPAQTPPSPTASTATAAATPPQQQTTATKEYATPKPQPLPQPTVTATAKPAQEPPSTPITATATAATPPPPQPTVTASATAKAETPKPTPQPATTQPTATATAKPSIAKPETSEQTATAAAAAQQKVASSVPHKASSTSKPIPSSAPLTAQEQVTPFEQQRALEERRQASDRALTENLKGWEANGKKSLSDALELNLKLKSSIARGTITNEKKKAMWTNWKEMNAKQESFNKSVESQEKGGLSTHIQVKKEEFSTYVASSKNTISHALQKDGGQDPELTKLMLGELPKAKADSSWKVRGETSTKRENVFMNTLLDGCVTNDQVKKETAVKMLSTIIDNDADAVELIAKNECFREMMNTPEVRALFTNSKPPISVDNLLKK